MDATTERQANSIIQRGWYRKSQTLGEGGWQKINSSGLDWKTYVLYSENPMLEEVEKIIAKDDDTAFSAFHTLYELDMFDYWEIQEKITEYRLVTTKMEE